MSTTVRGGYVDTRWGQVHYRIAGSSGPWIGLLHESPLSSKVYESVLTVLGRDARVVAFDTPGYGASDPPPAYGYEIPDYAEVLAEAATAIGMERPVLAGVHTGASIAIEMAHRLEVSGLSLSGVALLDEQERAEFLATWNPKIPFDDEGAQFDWAVERYRRIWPDLSAEMLHIACIEVLRVFDRYEWGYQAAFRHDPAAPLAALDVPVMLLDAEFDMLAHLDAKAMELAKDPRLNILPGLQGQPHLRAPEEFSAELLAFAREVAR
ncbi:alpha/beta fold hydrolase [Aeromicrobium wangtongii]|uniref:Alpha/beta hydrolase n=1 Tax=Aeromicrobium wangtongii TaxID=2969247 RepID=A0ABY5M8I6_9ACTN|nr:alpha/beta hydrolase [Aeromicrobium wangtongii]MCD9198695.1 alpha/beta hydrolase [Aeromicrobium wangtongii]UUP13259.1 alpha/beta hydrolase [Aeromicrobium wangtongii]